MSTNSGPLHTPHIVTCMYQTHLSEKDRAQQRLGNFAVDGSLGQWLIKELTGCKDLQLQSLLSLVVFLSEVTKIKLYRDDKRKKSLLVKWLDTHYAQILPFLPDITVTIKQDADWNSTDHHPDMTQSSPMLEHTNLRPDDHPHTVDNGTDFHSDTIWDEEWPFSDWNELLSGTPLD